MEHSGDLQWPYGHTNLIAVFLLSGVVVKLVKEYFAGEGAASTLKNSREEAKR